MEEFHEVFQFHVAFVLGHNKPAKAGLLKVCTFEDDAQVVEVVLLGDLAVSVVVDEVEDPADERVLPTQQA